VPQQRQRLIAIALLVACNNRDLELAEFAARSEEVLEVPEVQDAVLLRDLGDFGLDENASDATRLARVRDGLAAVDWPAYPCGCAAVAIADFKGRILYSSDGSRELPRALEPAYGAPDDIVTAQLDAVVRARARVARVGGQARALYIELVR
jgi:hypothetical protein